VAVAGLLASISITFVGLFLWLKLNLPAVDNKTAELVKHLKMYDAKDADKDEKESGSRVSGELLQPHEGFVPYYLGPHYSMGAMISLDNGNWQTYPACQQMYQCYLGMSFGANENSVIGDFGSGTGGPTRCTAQSTGIKIKAANITEYHLQAMQKRNEEEHIDHQIEPICSDYRHNPIEGNSLNGVYICESCSARRHSVFSTRGQVHWLQLGAPRKLRRQQSGSS
jgi:hypothetical protein